MATTRSNSSLMSTTTCGSKRQGFVKAFEKYRITGVCGRSGTSGQTAGTVTMYEASWTSSPVNRWSGW